MAHALEEECLEEECLAADNGQQEFISWNSVGQRLLGLAIGAGSIPMAEIVFL